jgi:aryl-alcohol dehydrogenase-like predicted oxidoreductase
MNMEYRNLGRTGWKISTIGSAWGAVDDRESLATLNRALDLGVNFFDTADAYVSEPLLGILRRQRHEPFYIVTKMGKGVNPDPRGYTRRNLTFLVENRFSSATETSEFRVDSEVCCSEAGTILEWENE